MGGTGGIPRHINKERVWRGRKRGMNNSVLAAPEAGTKKAQESPMRTHYFSIFSPLWEKGKKSRAAFKKSMRDKKDLLLLSLHF